MNALLIKQWKKCGLVVTSKSFAQVGTLVVAGRLPMSGELRSDETTTKKPRGRISPISVRYQSEEEVICVRTKAAKSELSVNNYIRKATLEHLWKPPLGSEFVAEMRQVKRQLTGIGINLNQLAHKANITGHAGEAVIDYIDIIREPVMDALKSIRRALAKTTQEPTA